MIYSYINASGIGKTRNCVKTRRSVFTKFRVFPVSTSVDITVYLCGIMFYISFIIWNKKNTKFLQWMSGGKFSVFTLSYVNTALNQSAFRIDNMQNAIFFRILFVFIVHRRFLLNLKRNQSLNRSMYTRLFPCLRQHL